MLDVSWTESALHDADTIAEYFLAKGTPVERVEDLLSYLLSLSRRFGVLLGKGSLEKVPGTREYRDARSRCRLVYEVTPEKYITILRILHDEVGFADEDNFVAVIQTYISPAKK